MLIAVFITEMVILHKYVFIIIIIIGLSHASRFILGCCLPLSVFYCCLPVLRFLWGFLGPERFIHRFCTLFNCLVSACFTNKLLNQPRNLCFIGVLSVYCSLCQSISFRGIK